MKTIAIILSAALTTTSLSSMAFFKEIARYEKQFIANKAKPKDVSRKTNEETQCINLAGKWKGSCDDSKEKYDSEYTIIQNDCNYIGLRPSLSDESGEFRFFDLKNGLLQNGNMTTQFSFSMAIAAKWNADQTVIQLEGAGIYNSQYASSIQNMRATSQLMLDNGELVEFSKIVGDSLGDRDVTCRYKKVSQ